MAQIRNYQKGVFETKSLAQISQVTDSTNTFLQFDGILTNAFSNLVLYADAGGASPLPLTSYASTTTDDTATALEAETSTGGSGYTVYSQLAVTDATYQNVDLYATFTNFGTYTDNDAAFNQMGAEVEISSSQTVALSDGAIHTTIIVDTSTADVTVTIDPASFTGQSCDVYCSGSNLAYLKDTDGNLYQGASSLGIPISGGLKCSIKDVSGNFVADYGKTADYVASLERIACFSDGVAISTVSVLFDISSGTDALYNHTFSMQSSKLLSVVSSGVLRSSDTSSSTQLVDIDSKGTAGPASNAQNAYWLTYTGTTIIYRLDVASSNNARQIVTYKTEYNY